MIWLIWVWKWAFMEERITLFRGNAWISKNIQKAIQRSDDFLMIVVEYCTEGLCLFVFPVSALEVLTLTEDPGPRQLSPEEQRRLEEQEENTLRELRLFLRDVTKRLATDKRFQIFSKPVDIEEVGCYCTSAAVWLMPVGSVLYSILPSN